MVAHTLPVRDMVSVRSGVGHGQLRKNQQLLGQSRERTAQTLWLRNLQTAYAATLDQTTVWSSVVAWAVCTCHPAHDQDGTAWLAVKTTRLSSTYHLDPACLPTRVGRANPSLPLR